MINTSSSSSPMLPGTAPAASPALAAPAQGGTRSAASTRGPGLADEPQPPKGNFAGAMKQAVDSQGTKTKETPHAAEPRRAEHAAPPDRPNATAAASEARPAPTTSAGSDPAAQAAATTGRTRAAASQATRLQAALALARAKPPVQPSAPQFEQAMNPANQGVLSGRASVAKVSDTDPAGATPLPVPTPIPLTQQLADAQTTQTAAGATEAKDQLPQALLRPETAQAAPQANVQSGTAHLTPPAMATGAADRMDETGLQRAAAAGSSRPSTAAWGAAESAAAGRTLPASGPGALGTAGPTGMPGEAPGKTTERSTGAARGGNPLASPAAGPANSANAPDAAALPSVAVQAGGQGAEQQRGGSNHQGHDHHSAHQEAAQLAGERQAQRALAAASSVGLDERALRAPVAVGGNTALADASAARMRAGQPGTPAAAVVDNGSAWPAAWVGAASTVGAAGGAPAASMPTSIEAPVGSAAFAAEAGYRIAVLVQGGVERAELQLNPVDMGPVTVQIAIDGLTAQVQLQAVQADTRQALEAAMPQLASQLSDAGLTLTGGGVFEQPQQQGKPQDAGSGNPEPGSRRNSDGRNGNDNLLAEQAGPARGSAVRLQRGMVDLVA